jgi:hypothetical protein
MRENRDYLFELPACEIASVLGRAGHLVGVGLLSAKPDARVHRLECVPD